MAKAIIAISGGVDSVVLTDIMVNSSSDELILAHFNHGIRRDSHEDEKLVKKLAQKYDLPLEIGRANLPENTSEDKARQKRYGFLYSVLKKYSADKIVTAHHSDDLIETVVINLIRGTGWRGLLPFQRELVERPLLNMSKADIMSYAAKNNISWREDYTNSDEKYLRNRVRTKIKKSLTLSQKQKIIELFYTQQKIAQQIEQILADLEYDKTSRYFFNMVPSEVALELLKRNSPELTGPQLTRLLLAIKTAAAGTVLQVGASVDVKFSQTKFHLIKHSQE